MQAKKYSIKDWARDDRPREKLLSKTPSALSDSELLAILINKGIKNKTAVDLAKEILYLGKNNLNELGKLSVQEMIKIKGIGEAKAITLAASMELGRRIQASSSLEKLVIRDSSEIAGFLKATLKDHRQEVFGVVFLNRANKIMV